MADATWNDITNSYNAAITVRNAGGVSSHDFELEGALNAAYSALSGLALAAERAQLREQIRRAKNTIQLSERKLGIPEQESEA